MVLEVTKDIESAVVWVDQGMGHGHVALVSFFKKVESGKIVINGTEQLVNIRDAINDYLKEEQENGK